MKNNHIGKIRIVMACFAQGVPLPEGRVLNVPVDIPVEKARNLVVLKRAVIVPPAEKPAEAPAPAAVPPPEAASESPKKKAKQRK